MSSGSQIKGFDIFHGDGIVQFGLAKQAGYLFMFAKASQGTADADPMFANNRSRAHEVGLVFGAYHFFTSEDPVEQAQYFLSIAAPQPGELVLTLDVETYFDGVAEAALTAAQYIKQQTGRYPIIYTGQSFYQSYLADTFPGYDYTLWIARYGAPPDPSIKWAFWQNSESGQINGTASPLDTDVFSGTMAHLLTHTIAPAAVAAS